MAIAQWVVLGLTIVAAGLASYFYNDGRDHQLKLVLGAAAVIGAVGTGLFFLAGALTPTASSVPQCDWSDLDDDLMPRCESPAEAASRAADESLDQLSSYVIGPAIEFAGVVGGSAVGLFAALATHRKPSDGRTWRLFVD